MCGSPPECVGKRAGTAARLQGKNTRLLPIPALPTGLHTPDVSGARVPDGPPHYLHRLWRAALQPTSILTLEELIEALPFPHADTRAWLLEHVAPMGALAGIRVYRWSEVLTALTGSSIAPPLPPTTSVTAADLSSSRWLSTAQAAARLGIARCTLDEMVSQAPRTLPGTPTPVGSGNRRRHWRWDGDMLEEWLTAYRAWTSQRSPVTESLPLAGRTTPHASNARKPAPAPTPRRRSLLSVVSGARPAGKR